MPRQDKEALLEWQKKHKHLAVVLEAVKRL